MTNFHAIDEITHRSQLRIACVLLVFNTFVARIQN
jgi:hypothetical protein